jgi:hypothetical protein
VHGVQMTDVEASYMQFVKWNSPSFVYVHLTSGRREQVGKETMMHRRRPRVWLSVTTILVAILAASFTFLICTMPTLQY